MAWADIYAKTVAELKLKNGSYDEKTPKLHSWDMVAFLGLYTSNVVQAVERASEAIVRSDYADSDGLLAPQFRPFDIDTTTTASDYVSKFVGTQSAWKRTPTQLTDQQKWFAQTLGIKVLTYEPVRYPTVIASTQLEQIDQVRQMMDDRESALDASAHALGLYQLGFASKDLCVSFLAGMRRLGTDLDVLAENPPVSLSEEVAGALDAAKKKSEAALQSIGNAAGKAAAEIGNLAGNVAGAAASGFFDQATLLTLAVAGVAAYVALR